MTVSLPDRAAYQVALEKAEKANALEPNDPAKGLEAGSFFSGLIDDVRIYNRAITP